MPNAPKQFRLGPSQQQLAKQYDARRGTPAERGYGPRWRKLVAWLRTQPKQALCGICGRAPSEMFDHVEAVRGKDDPLFFEPSNIIGECRKCHNMKTNVCDGGFGRARSAEGRRLLERLKEEARRRAEASEQKREYA